MQINLRLSPSAEKQAVTIDKGSSVEQLIAMYEDQLPFRIYAARINNRVVTLDTKIPEDSDVVLLDMRDPSGKQCCQNSVMALYLYAASFEFPGEKIVVSNSLNRGIFTFFKENREIEEHQINNIEKRMRSLQKQKLPIKEIECEYSLVVPNTAYIRNFDLKPCHGGIVVRVPEDTHPGGLAPYREDEKLYGAFADESTWTDMLGIKYYSDLNSKLAAGEMKDIIQVSEALHEKRIAELAVKIKESGKRIVLIAGPSSSGKTSFAKRLCTQIWVNGSKPIYLGTDDFFIDRLDIPFGPDGTQDFESLSAVDVDLFNRSMNALLNGEEVDIPRFDFVSGKKVFGENKITASPGQVIVIEGIHGLNDALTPQIRPEDKFRIYISPLTQVRIDDHKRIPLTDVRKMRRIVRDSDHRGWNAEHTIDIWSSVRAGEDKNIFPFSDSADALFNSTQVYELSALKARVKPLLEQIDENAEQYTEALRLLRLLDAVDELPEEYEKCIPCNSILREFIGGSSIA